MIAVQGPDDRGGRYQAVMVGICCGGSVGPDHNHSCQGAHVNISSFFFCDPGGMLRNTIGNKMVIEGDV